LSSRNSSACSATISFKSCASRPRCLTSSVVAARAVSPASRRLPAIFVPRRQVRTAGGETELMETERQIDEILKGELEKYAHGSVEPTEAAALGLATQRQQHLIELRRATLGGRDTAARET
jgi:hypothetical protein